ncbi:MAG: sensor histidine kinase [Pedobacter sp.]|nr:MAG: sensor histidine kinase [Pedobacter sp.]
MKHLFLILFLLCRLNAWSQKGEFDLRFRHIDSLIFNQKYELVQLKLDSLKAYLANNKHLSSYKEIGLEIRYREVLMMDNLNQTPSKMLPSMFKLLDESESLALPQITFRVYLLIALCYEKTSFVPQDYELGKQYLDKAYAVFKKHNLDEMYSAYCIRVASYYRYARNVDSLVYFANQASKYARKYNQPKELEDSYTLLISASNAKQDYKSALRYSNELLSIRLKHQNELGPSYYNVANAYLLMKDYPKALIYMESAYLYFDQMGPLYKPIFSEKKSNIYEGMGKMDSALHYYKLFSEYSQQSIEEQNLVKTRELEEKYQNDKKEQSIKNRERLLLLVGCLMTAIFVAWLLVVRKNRQISEKNKIISSQLLELTKTLEQKQVLLSELQHRVKNNLQHVISILEIQKESVDFNNIDELIRGNQNRIHSMALLHKKLSVSENVNEVDLEKYISELAKLVKDSYASDKKRIQLEVKCEVEKISLEKALPVGLIITELISNSMKHAFKRRSTGRIQVVITESGSGKALFYADSGVGFDFNALYEKGLGQEIINGLIDQLGEKVESSGDNGFELRVGF